MQRVAPPAYVTWSAVLAAAGFAVSGYLTLTHYLAGQVPLACASSGLVDCEQVTTSAESMLGPIPVAVLGLAWFAMGLVLVGARWARSDARLLTGQLVWSALGVLFVFYLVYAELFLIGAICTWCTVVHVVVVAMFLLTLTEATAPPQPSSS